MIKPWNEWHGLTEGDMIDELVELDVSHGHTNTREHWEGMRPEAIRIGWWVEIGRHTVDTQKETQS